MTAGGVGIQDWIAAGCAATALAWLVVRAVRKRRKHRDLPMCDGCPGCQATRCTEIKFHSLEPPTRETDRGA